MKKLYGYIIGILIVAITAVLSGLFVKVDTEWFMTLIKPEFYPPPIVFSISWSIIYLITAYVIAQVINKGDNNKLLALLIAQCALQIIWCLLFFTLMMSDYSLFILIALVIINGIITVNLFDIDDLSGWLYFVAFCWFVFACTLNYSIVMLN